tara:strand:+ start:247 stop:1824 length:1578 start_codon:yes stop_codon:yes gene_type:complete
MKIKRALISVSDKEGLIPLAKELQKKNIEIFSTGGTAKTLTDNNIKVKDIADYIDFPEIMDGRVKTLHPKIHGGLLCIRDNQKHIASSEIHKIQNIDLLIVNLYPFQDTVEKNSSFDKCIENIDIGGPSMIRSAAKNHKFVTVVVDKYDYKTLIKEMEKNNNSTSAEYRKELALKAFKKTAEYDGSIAAWLQEEKILPPNLFISAKREKILRYGENPHQRAAIYWNTSSSNFYLKDSHQIQGKELSYNNINDANAAFNLVSDLSAFNKPAVAIIKHANPCGAAIAETLHNAYKKAFNCDQTSAFGGIVALSEKVNEKTAIDICNIFTELVIAPDFDKDAIKVFSKKKNLRILKTDSISMNKNNTIIKSISGGFLVQTSDNINIEKNSLKIVTKRKPTNKEVENMLFAFKVAKHVKSNAIVYAKDRSTVGIGAGQMNRLDSAFIAAHKAFNSTSKRTEKISTNLLLDSVAASDAFFPFPDAVEIISKAGSTAIIQPGGSIKDDEVIKTADKAGISMAFTGFRHFNH